MKGNLVFFSVRALIIIYAIALSACVSTTHGESDDLLSYVNSSSYKEYKVEMTKKAMPEAARKECGHSFSSDKDALVLVNRPVIFKQFSNIALLTNHTYGHPVSGEWVEKILIMSANCGNIGLEIKATAVPENFPKLDMTYTKNVERKEFLKRPETWSTFDWAAENMKKTMLEKEAASKR